MKTSWGVLRLISLLVTRSAGVEVYSMTFAREMSTVFTKWPLTGSVAGAGF